MKKSAAKPAKTPEPPVFSKTLHRVRLRPDTKAAASPKAKKRDNIFSKSRDTREDRGERQIKTSHNAQTFSHGH